MIRDPTILPFFSISCPLARSGNSTCDKPVTTSGYSNPKITVVTKVNHSEMRRFFFISSSNNLKIRQQYVDQFNSDERGNDSTHAVDQQVVAKKGGRTQGPVPYATESEWNQSDDNQSVENYGRQNCRFRRVQMHHIQDIEDWESRGKHGGYDREVLGNVVGH